MNRSRVGFGVFAFVVVLAFGHPCLAGNPVALIYDIQGGSDRPLEAFSEFAAGDEVTLNNDTELTFLHYPTCTTVVLKGGHLSFTDERYMLRKGEVVSEQVEKCPKTVVLDEGDEIGGVVMRSASAKLKLATVPAASKKAIASVWILPATMLVGSVQSAAPVNTSTARTKTRYRGAVGSPSICRSRRWG